jgi:protease II
MELLDLFESQMESLVMEVQSLRKENAKLREDSTASLSTLTEENAFLKNALEEEQHLKEAVLKRVEGWLSHLQEINPSAE